MISVLAQERLLGAALGTVFSGAIVFEERKWIYRSISGEQSHGATRPQMKEPIFGQKSRSEVAHLWNRTVDQMFRPIIEVLSSRGW